MMADQADAALTVALAELAQEDAELLRVILEAGVPMKEAWKIVTTEDRN